MFLAFQCFFFPMFFFTEIKLWNESCIEQKFSGLNISVYIFCFLCQFTYTYFCCKKKNGMFIYYLNK
nr:hypothetical protein CparaKRNrm1_p114 [Cryptomonas paramecium]